MNLRVDVYIVGWLLAAMGLFKLSLVLVAVVFSESWWPYALSAAITMGAGLTLVVKTRTKDWRIRPRDGFLVVGCGWILVSLLGALPYVVTGTLGVVDALFESVSGFTTTGSTVITKLEELPRTLLLWRSFSQWIGGIGIILFTIAVLPLLGIGGMQLFKAEVPGPVADKLRPRLIDTARQLWLIYVGLTIAQCVLLLAVGVTPFEALCHAFTTLPTGGFSTRDGSIGALDSPATEWIVTLFMFLAGVNFVLHYRLIQGRLQEAWRDSELWYFIGIVLGAIGIVSLGLWTADQESGAIVRRAAFQVVSMVTTTGYVTADFELWPSVTHVVLLGLMILGGMSGSTGGGVKTLRSLLGFRALGVAFERLIHPRVVRSVKYAGQPVSEEVLAGIWAFFIAYLLLATVAVILVTAAGYDLETALSAALTCIGNVGPGLGQVGAYDTFAHFPAVIKLVLAFCMLAGRLEIFTLLVLLVPEFWRR